MPSPLQVIHGSLLLSLGRQHEKVAQDIINDLEENGWTIIPKPKPIDGKKLYDGMVKHGVSDATARALIRQIGATL